MLSAERIDLLVGTRPEAIKMAPVARALAAAGLDARLILTGQHPLDPASYDIDKFDVLRLSCPSHGDPFEHADRVCHMVLAVLQDDPPALLMYSFPNEDVTPSSSLGLIVHHPKLGIALKERMDALGIECIVQYRDEDSGQTVRHGDDAPPTTAVEFIRNQFERARSAGPR